MFTPPIQEVYSISVGDSFTIPTVTATDAFKQDIAVTHTTDLNINVAGVYEIFYTATNEVGTSELKITVYVIDENTDTGITINIHGELPESIYTNESITLPNATAYDFIGNQLDVYITPNKVLNIKNEGSIEITYYAVDSFGNYKEIKFTIVVEKNTNGNLPEPGDYLSYYNDIVDLTGSDLFNELHSLLRSTAKIKSYGGNLNPVLIDADKHPTMTGMVYTVYDGAAMASSASGASGSSVWNKEHVIPKSWYNSKYKSHEGDVHNLRISRASINSTRGNKKFVDGSGTWNSGFYPGDDHKGDVARIAMYMIVMLPDVLTFNTVMNNGKAILMRWHMEDPVDDFEIRRNQILYEFQGNRNPFIDYPELANIVFN